jgi:hypothetical protein
VALAALNGRSLAANTAPGYSRITYKKFRGRAAQTRLKRNSAPTVTDGPDKVLTPHPQEVYAPWGLLSSSSEVPLGGMASVFSPGRVRATVSPYSVLHMIADVASLPFDTLPPLPYNPRLGRALTRAGGATLVVSLLPWVIVVAVGAGYRMNSDDVGSVAFLIVATLISLMIWLVGVALIGRGRRLQSCPALQLMQRDPRRPILFLRSFDDDDLFDPTPRMIPLGDYFPRRYEESLAQALRTIGPMITIGRPGDELALLGGARLCVPDHAWKTAVEYLRNRASVVVLMIGRSQGLWWEITSSLESVPIERLLCFFPYVEETKRRRSFMQRFLYYHPAEMPLFKGAYRRMELEREKRYALFQERVQPLLAKSLALRLDNAQFVDFLPDGTPRVLQSVRPWWWPLAIFTPSMRRMLTNNERTLQPFLEKFQAHARPHSKATF